MNLFLFGASLRKNSYNKQLIAIATQIAREQGVTCDLADFGLFDAPLYNEDIEKNIGWPTNITTFIKRMKNADGLVISSPEYNHSTPGTLKNLIDWVSRVKPTPWKNYPVLLMSASPSVVGGNRGLWATRIPLECCGSFVFPDMFSLSQAAGIFDEQGRLKDDKTLQRLQKNIQGFIAYTKALKALSAA